MAKIVEVLDAVEVNKVVKVFTFTKANVKMSITKSYINCLIFEMTTYIGKQLKNLTRKYKQKKTH